MSRQATSAPSRARRMAVARPMPRGRAAPVTRATVPAKRSLTAAPPFDRCRHNHGAVLAWFARPWARSPAGGGGGQVVRAAGQVAALGPDGGPPRLEDPEQLVEVLAERLDRRGTRGVGRLLDRLPRRPTRVGEAVV